MYNSATFVVPNLQTYILTPSVLDQYLYFEKYGYPPRKFGLSTRVIQNFVDWTDRHLRNTQNILFFKDIFEKVFILFQESENETEKCTVSATEISV